jgi:hypothetical protein
VHSITEALLVSTAETESEMSMVISVICKGARRFYHATALQRNRDILPQPLTKPAVYQVLQSQIAFCMASTVKKRIIIVY